MLTIEKLESRWMLAGTGIVNGSFDVADPTEQTAFGWDTVGRAEARGQQGVLSEEAGDLSEWIQSFEIPTGAQKLAFTLVDAALNDDAVHPPDTFEVALLDAATSTSLVETVQGLNDSDALLNINGTGQVFFGPRVTVPGASQSGNIVALNYPLTVEVDISGVAASTQATLYFDLPGFGGVDARITLDDVILLGDLKPTLTLAFDPATDSGDQGDAYTNFTTVNLIGTSEAGQAVVLDTDGDGFDDGDFTVGADRQFHFDGITFPEGSTELAVQATNQHGTTALSRTFVFDSQPITGQLLSPAPGSIFREDPGFVEMQWTDTGVAGNNPATFDAGDVTITGVSVDHIEDLGGGHVRYWYNDDGQSLPFGRITVQQVAGGVSDRAGNGNVEHATFFARLRNVCTWQNSVNPLDVDGDGTVVPLDVLLVINRINSLGSGELPDPVMFPNVPPPFYDVKCDGWSVPIDALLVINHLNQRGGGEGEESRLAALDQAFSDLEIAVSTKPELAPTDQLNAIGNVTQPRAIGFQSLVPIGAQFTAARPRLRAHSLADPQRTFDDDLTDLADDLASVWMDEDL